MSAEPRRRENESDDERPSGLESSSSAPLSSTTTNNPSTTTGGGDDDAEAAEIAAMKARVAEMEAEAAKLRELTAASEAAQASANGGGQEGDVAMSDEDREATDQRSVYVGNVRSSRSLSLFPHERLIPSSRCRSIMLPLPKKSNNISLHVERSTESRFSLTSSRVRKGQFSFFTYTLRS